MFLAPDRSSAPVSDPHSVLSDGKLDAGCGFGDEAASCSPGLINGLAISTIQPTDRPAIK